MCQEHPHLSIRFVRFLSCSTKILPPLILAQVDALVAALPLAEGGEEAQLKRIAELQVWSSHISPSKVSLLLHLTELRTPSFLNFW